MIVECYSGGVGASLPQPLHMSTPELLNGKQWASSCWQLVAAVEATLALEDGSHFPGQWSRDLGGACSLGNILKCDVSLQGPSPGSVPWKILCASVVEFSRRNSVVQFSLMKGWASNSGCRAIQFCYKQRIPTRKPRSFWEVPLPSHPEG